LLAFLAYCTGAFLGFEKNKFTGAQLKPMTFNLMLYQMPAARKWVDMKKVQFGEKPQTAFEKVW
jgi:hypothetical protein